MTDSENTFATQKEMTRTHPNQSLDTSFSPIILSSKWQLAAFPYDVRKAAKLKKKFIFEVGTLNPYGVNERFSFN